MSTTNNNNIISSGQGSNTSGSLFGIDDVSAFLNINTLPHRVPDKVREELLTFSKSYNRPVKPIIEFRDVYGDLIDTFNSFRVRYKDPAIPVKRCEIVKTKGQAGNFALEIIDHKGELDTKRIRESNRILIKVGREEGNMKNHLSGICTNMRLQRGRGDLQYWVMLGYGKGLIAAETILNMKQSARFTSGGLGTEYDSHDSLMYACNLIRQIHEDESLTADSRISLRDLGNFKLDKISQNVREFIPSINAKRVEAGALCQHIADASGAEYFYNENDEVVFDYPSFHNSGVTLKQYVEDEAINDFGNKTSYFYGDWTGEYSTLKENGFGNCLITSTGKLRERVAGSEVIGSYINTWNKDIAQQIPVTAEFKDLVFLMTKRGTGSPNVTNLHGHIKADRAGRPTGIDVATFDIPLSSIPVSENPFPIQVSNIEYNPSAVPSSGLVWVIFYERGDSDDRTVNIFHDNLYTGFDGANNNRYLSAFRPLPNGRTNPDNPPHNSANGWQINQDGPQFVYSAYQVFSFSGIFEEPWSQEHYRKVMAPYDPPWTDDLHTTAKIAHAILQTSARPKGDYVHNQVFIPEDYYFPVGDRFIIEDIHSGHTPTLAKTLEIGQARIVFDSTIDQMGTDFMQILPFGYKDIELEDFVYECGVV